tara:strand:+ start:79 stop:303 length:225 start_codon:yes stop_codon:yes gene_type:complete
MAIFLGVGLSIVWIWVLWCIIKGKLLREELHRYTWDRVRGFCALGFWLSGLVLVVTGFIGVISGYDPDLLRFFN